MDETLKMLKELTDANGTPGNEREPRQVMQKHIAPFADHVETDHLGSLIAKKTGAADDAPKIMVAGHLDEIGFMVTTIDENGFIKFQPLGGWWEQVMLAQRVTVMGKNGNVPGVIGSKPPHVLAPEARKKAIEKKDMFIDVGASSKEEAESFGIRPGDSVVPVCDFTVMKNEKYLMAKAWDNRIGCAIAVDVLRALADESHPNTVYGVGTVQEEVGLRGARTSAHRIQPDIGFGVDVGIAGDTPGITANDAQSKMGAGPSIIMYDASMISHKGLRDFVTETADEKEIPYQYDAMAGGGTDSGSIHLTADGVPALSITVPTRYIHTHAAILHRDDYEHAVKLITEVIKKLDRDTITQLTFD
ncbi:M42 family metallopeptidase [Salisediminibacterium halotolerans]|uniref:Endoglucanase n=1 Tax=Salisediminibacterium halotolerans TaxID=517425 RepID=A0A1H9U081_9BACI|nr:M42 family metallopeptidase [Salisediminibacterium haloalkalitolerans]SES03060.1 endoglucanase [Salisediminibacterium haloalkalitolerans]